MNAIVLIGFMGAGKSAVGRELARRLNLTRRDTDEIIRQRFSKTIPEIFASVGETAFRDAETAVLREVQNNGAIVLVTGGGIVLREENRALLMTLGSRVWLDGEEETLWQRASRRNDRPLLQSRSPRTRFHELYFERTPYYRAAANVRVDTTGKSIGDVADEILAG